MIKQNKVTDEELKKIKEFQERQSEIISTIGTLEYQLIFLKEQKEDIVEKLFEVEGDINDFTKMLNDKYGSGQVDLKTGELIKN